MKNQILVKVNSKKKRHYPVIVGCGLLKQPTKWIPKQYTNIIIITDNNVKKIYGNSLLKKLSKYRAMLISFPSGEKYKNSKTKEYIENQMLRNGFTRDSIIIALGGGVVGDLAGFVAATYMRGIPYIQVPTTFLAMVDSSSGGKTGIDTIYGKNLIGALWQPEAVIVDTECLKTLTKKQIVNGLIESLKMFLTNDLKSFIFMQQNLEKILLADQPLLTDIILRSANIKSAVIKKDEYDNHQRMILNFGHTIGHALEYISNYKLMHGYAVGLGILIEAKISELLGILNSKNFYLIETLLSNLGIKAKILKKWSIAKILQATKQDKKRRSDGVRYVLLQDMGKIYQKNNHIVHTVGDNIVKQAFNKVIGA